jgi:hypothetical protein
MVLNADHARRGQILGELIRRSVGFAAKNMRKLEGLDQFQWRRIFSKYESSRRCIRSYSECSNPEEIPLVRTHPSLLPVKNSTDFSLAGGNAVRVAPSFKPILSFTAFHAHIGSGGRRVTGYTD